MEFSEWEEKVSNISRKYSHFDLWTSYQNVREYILDSLRVKSHGFYPLIHFEMPKPKWVKEQGKGRVCTEKKRNIFMQHISILGYIGIMHIVLMKLTIGMHHN